MPVRTALHERSALGTLERGSARSVPGALPSSRRSAVRPGNGALHRGVASGCHRNAQQPCRARTALSRGRSRSLTCLTRVAQGDLLPTVLTWEISLGDLSPMRCGTARSKRRHHPGSDCRSTDIADERLSRMRVELMYGQVDRRHLAASALGHGSQAARQVCDTGRPCRSVLSQRSCVTSRSQAGLAPSAQV